MFKLPPTSALTVLPLTTAPCRLVSPPLVILRTLPLTWVLMYVVSVPSPRPLPWLMDALTVSPLVPIPMPTLAPLLLLVLVCVFVLAAAVRLTLLSACRLVSPPACTFAPWMVRLLLVPAPVALMLTLPPAAIELPRAESLPVRLVLSLLDDPMPTFTLKPPALSIRVESRLVCFPALSVPVAIWSFLPLIMVPMPLSMAV